MVKKKIMWEATDGSLHATEGLAEQASNLADLQDYVDEHPLMSVGGDRIDGADLVLWMKENDRIYIQLLPEYPQNPTPRVNIADPDDVVIYETCDHEWKTAKVPLNEPSHMYCDKCGVNVDELYLGNKNCN